MLFPGKKPLMPLAPKPEMEAKPSAALGLAHSYPNNTVTQGGNPSKRHLDLFHVTDTAFGMPDKHSLSARHHYFKVKPYF